MKENYTLNVRQKLCLTLGLVVFCVAQALAVTKDVSVGNFKIRLDTETKEAVVLQNGLFAYSGDVVIPSVVEDNGVEYPVVELPAMLFYGCYDLTSVQLPKSLRKIGKQCFLDCKKLTEIAIPSTLKELGAGCFHDCSGLLKLDLSSTSVTELPTESFYGCTGLRTIQLPASLSMIGSSAFSYCSKLDGIVLPENTTEIGASCFQWCDALSEIKIPSHVKVLGDYSFANCKNLLSVEVASNSSLEKLGKYCFTNTKVQEINIDAPIANVGDNVFEGCSNLKKAFISDNCLAESLGSNCFKDCVNLTEVHLPKSLKGLDASTFSSCGKLQELVIPSMVTSLGANCFDGCESLTNIQLSQSLQSIGMRCFSGCLALKELAVPASVTFIGTWAFMNTGIEKIEISEGLSYIGNYTFEYCGKLQKIILPSTLETVGTDFLGSNDNLTEVVCLAVEPPSYHPINVYYPMVSTYLASQATLYVPTESVQKYKDDKNWGVFYKIKPYTATNGIKCTESTSVRIEARDGFVNVTGLAHGIRVAAYTLDGKLLAMTTANNGIASLNIGAGVVILKIGGEMFKLQIK